MANLIDKTYSDIKNQLAIFLANQSILLSLEKKIKNISDETLKSQLKSKWEQLYASQKKIETEAMKLMSAIGDYKTQIELQMKTEQGSYDIFSNFKGLTADALNFTQQGIKITGLMLNQNKSVKDLQTSVEQNKIVVSSDETEMILKAIYGLLGIGIIFFLIKRNKQ